MIRILIVDDYDLIRAGLRMLIEKEVDMEIVGEAQDGAKAITLAAETQPDVITLDLGLPDQQGLDVIGQLKEVCPDARVLVVTGIDDPKVLRRVLQAGAHGYVVKMADIRALVGAIRSVHDGRAFLNVTFNEELAKLLSPAEGQPYDPAQRNPEVNRLPQDLSEREVDVLRNVALGFSNKQIGERLKLSVKTIETYRSRLHKKLALKDRADLVRFALNAGLLSQANVENQVS